MTGLQKLCALVTNRSGKRRKRKQTNQYVLYFRVSTRRQGESGLGLEEQKSAAEAFVKQQGGTVLEVTVVEQKTGTFSIGGGYSATITPLCSGTWPLGVSLSTIEGRS